MHCPRSLALATLREGQAWRLYQARPDPLTRANWERASLALDLARALALPLKATAEAVVLSQADQRTK